MTSENETQSHGPDEGSPEYWRAGCECARAGLCYRCRAASVIEHLIKARNRDHEQAWQNGMEAARLRQVFERVVMMWVPTRHQEKALAEMRGPSTRGCSEK